jgi:hypothetical protein
VALALAGVSAGTRARAQDIAMPCDAFVKNPGGSWTPVSDVPIGGMGRKLVLRQGSELRPGAIILGVDFATLLERQCPAVAVTAPEPAPPAVAAAPAPAAQPRADLSKFADANGNVDIQKLTCGQFADASREDADFLGAMYIGWYNGLSKKNAINVTRARDVILDIASYCKANPGQRVTQAIELVRNQAWRKLPHQIR